jgi:hypothetical protein
MGARFGSEFLLLASDLSPGPVASCIGAGLAACSPGWAGRPLVDAVRLKTAASSHLPIAILMRRLSKADMKVHANRPRPSPILEVSRLINPVGIDVIETDQMVIG